MLNPILKNGSALFIYVVIWTLVAGLHFVLLRFFYHFSYAVSITDAAFSNFSFALLSLSSWYIVRYVNVEHKGTVNLVINHFIAAIILSGLWTGVNYFLYYEIFADYTLYNNFLAKSLAWRFASGMLFYFVIILIYYLIIYYHNYQNKRIDELNLRNIVKETKLSYLKAQLNPHFLFNSLNSISSLTTIDPEKAQEMIIKLSSYLRFTLDQKENKLIPFEDELENCQLYLEIEKIRFGKRLKIENIIDENSCNIKVPNMILQPLYENAVKYSVHESIDTITITTKTEMTNKAMEITISNNIDKNSIARKGKGIGLKNIKSRLKLIYNSDDLIKINKAEDRFEVKILVPIM